MKFWSVIIILFTTSLVLISSGIFLFLQNDPGIGNSYKKLIAPTITSSISQSVKGKWVNEENNAAVSVSPSPILLSTRENVKVLRVVDGDTIQLTDGRTVRYIGINTPEAVDRRKKVECFGTEASLKNKEYVEGKTIQIEKDISETDRYGRLLRYIYVDGIFLNEYLVREGFAQASSYPPDIKYQEKLQSAQKIAREEKKGLWGGCRY